MNDPFATPPRDSRYRPVADHAHRYATTGGRDGHLWNGVPTLLLTTLGRRTGTARRTALIYGRRGPDYLVAASNLGSDHHPHWYRNLQHHPRARVQVLDHVFEVSARTADAGERPALWEQMTALWPAYADYQAATARTIAIVLLHPQHPAPHEHEARP
ncbi:nitroreductase family deazaflavin-dependent oxidoreductase [Streptomyces sp. NPDC021100]|uniref:nitroreductase family deazaflavin-dependent oxidoreductase n=1 Tax=Streptomyces sp. NPDC021100 TaxID=3365114 RepID=UPI00378EE85E